MNTAFADDFTVCVPQLSISERSLSSHLCVAEEVLGVSVALVTLLSDGWRLALNQIDEWMKDRVGLPPFDLDNYYFLSSSLSFK